MPANSASGNSAQTLNPEPSASPPPIDNASTPCNCSGLQRQSPAPKKRKHAVSGADKSNKKQKEATKDTTEDDDNDSQVTGKGKGSGKGKTATNRAQEDAVADAAGAPSQLMRTERLLEGSSMPIAPPMCIRSTTATHLPPPPPPNLVTGRQCRSDAAKPKTSNPAMMDHTATTAMTAMTVTKTRNRKKDRTAVRFNVHGGGIGGGGVCGVGVEVVGVRYEGVKGEGTGDGGMGHAVGLIDCVGVVFCVVVGSVDLAVA
ncbi:hypothetical protein K443DRAFT_11402, partial [Laccaria amethystina LaAM-08-1]